MKSRKIVFIDLDDTLISNAEVYVQQKEKFADFLYKVHRWNPEFAIEVLDRIDKENILAFGFGKHRFPGSMGEAYEQLCTINGIGFSKSIRDSCIEIGYEVFDYIPVWFPESRPTLTKLKEMGYVVHLVTMGDIEVQKRKIELLGIRKYVQNVHIVPEKTTLLYQDLADYYVAPNGLAFMVGNSWRSDIEPVLPVQQISPIYYSNDAHWDFNGNHDPATGVPVISNLNELFKYIV